MIFGAAVPYPIQWVYGGRVLPEALCGRNDLPAGSQGRGVSPSGHHGTCMFMHVGVGTYTSVYVNMCAAYCSK